MRRVLQSGIWFEGVFVYGLGKGLGAWELGIAMLFV